MLQVHAAGCTCTPTAAFLLSSLKSRILTGSRYWLHLCACVLILRYTLYMVNIIYASPGLHSNILTMGYTLQSECNLWFKVSSRFI